LISGTRNNPQTFNPNKQNLSVMENSKSGNRPCNAKVKPSISCGYLIAALLLTAMAGVSHGGTVVVTPGNMDGWAFLTTDADGVAAPGNGNTAQMVTGPATPPLGTGSAQLGTASGQGDTSSQIRNTAYAGTPLADLTVLSYSTYMTANNGQQFPYIELNIATTGSGAPDDILFFEPPYQTPTSGNPNLLNQGDSVLNTWQTWNALAGGWWDNNGVLNPGTGVGSLADYLVTYPDATIENSSAGYGGVRLTVGFASPEDNFNGYVDNVTIGTTGGTTTYDFEPATVPEPTTAGCFLLGLGALVYFQRFTQKRRS
jgi:hypothetical protein